ncbi:MAG: hypothetical protein KF765_07165 [Parvibaculaceae bacterium]|nr:hypothetical protein [Parvibaculaceae bacterium]
MTRILGHSLRTLGFSLAAVLTVSGCTVVEGGAKNDKAAPAAPVAAVEAPAPANDELTTGGIASIASANIPIPLPSPRQQAPVQVASVDPSAGIASLSARPQLQQLAGVYADYGSAVAAVGQSKLNTPSDVRRAVAALRFSQPDALADGWYATHAMIAAQDAGFSQGIRDEVRHRGKTAVLAAIESDDKYILTVRGARSATEAVTAALKAENARMAALSARFKETSYAFQKQRWGMSTPLPAQGETKTAEADDDRSFMERAGDMLAALSPVTPAQAYSPSVMNRVLTLAAYQVIDGSMDAGATTARNPTGRCLNWARLNLDQCLAASRFPSEEAYCAGKHAVEEVRGCWAEAVPASVLAAQ